MSVSYCEIKYPTSYLESELWIVSCQSAWYNSLHHVYKSLLYMARM